jgi:AraC-like DNA-binding protein
MKKKKDLLCDLAIEFILTRDLEELGELTAVKIARELKISWSYLARIFKRERNISLREYLLREKMVRAASLLIDEPQITIKKLSEKMGFEDANYFAYVFKKYYGVSPGRYRDCKKKVNSPDTMKKVNHFKQAKNESWTSASVGG